MSMYVPDEKALGNPGVFGFLGKAISTVGQVLTGQKTIKLPQPVINVQSPAPQVNVPIGQNLPPWVIPVGLGAVALFVLVPMLKRR